MSKYRAKKTVCSNGHKHDSKREAKRCDELYLLERGNAITHLHVHPKFEFFINGEPLKMKNGHTAGYTADFQYRDGNKAIVEDVKGFIVRDFPLRSALFSHLYPDYELRIT